MRPGRSEQALLRAPGPAPGRTVLRVNHHEAQEAKQAPGQAGPDPYRWPTSGQQHGRRGEPRDGADADHRPRIGEAGGQRSGSRRHTCTLAPREWRSVL